MGSYNAYAEKRIDELIKQAYDREIQTANETLKTALDILDKNFVSHPIDSAKDDLIRIESKIRIYEKIICAYDELICQLTREDEDLPELEKGLKNL